MENEKQTCLITIVQPGLPDSVIRISPADHKEEKIWLDTRPGIERWEGIKTLMKRFCPRGQYVPEPAYYHPTSGAPEDLATRLINGPEDIPSLELDGATLSAPPVKERVRLPEHTDLQTTKQQVVTLTVQVGQLTAAVASLVEKVAAPVAPPKKPGRPRKEEIA